jgi:hypothetical protein
MNPLINRPGGGAPLMNMYAQVYDSLKRRFGLPLSTQLWIAAHLAAVGLWSNAVFGFVQSTAKFRCLEPGDLVAGGMLYVLPVLTALAAATTAFAYTALRRSLPSRGVRIAAWGCVVLLWSLAAVAANALTPDLPQC